MDARYEKAKGIVAEGKVRESHGAYYVAAASEGVGAYRVELHGLEPTCTCAASGASTSKQPPFSGRSRRPDTPPRATSPASRSSARAIRRTGRTTTPHK